MANVLLNYMYPGVTLKSAEWNIKRLQCYIFCYRESITVEMKCIFFFLYRILITENLKSMIVPVELCVHLFFYLSVFWMSVYLYRCSLTCLFDFSLSIYLLVCLSVSLAICLSVSLTICLSTYLFFACLPIFLSIFFPSFRLILAPHCPFAYISVLQLSPRPEGCLLSLLIIF